MSKSSKPFRIQVAILVCDTPIEPVLRDYGDYFILFQELLKQGFNNLDLSEEDFNEIGVEFIEHQIVGASSFPSLDNIDAVVITGSKHDAWADDLWIRSLTTCVRDTILIYNKPVVGVCFGHQILARALGAQVGRNDAGWEISVENMALTEVGKKLFGKDTLSIQQMHRDIVFDAPPAGCTNLATTSKCGVQGLYLANKILSVQGHPEFNEGIMSHVLEARHVNGVFDTELYNDGLSRAAKPHDGELIGYTMAKFIMDARKANK